MRTFLLAVLLALGCASATTVQTDPSPSPSPNPGITIARASDNPLASRAALWTVADTIGLRRPAMIRRYGAPISSAGHSFDSQIDEGKRDSLETLRFPHFEAQYHVRTGGRYALAHITIAEPLASIPAAARPGSSLTDLIAFLGTPEDQSQEDEGLLLLFELKPDDDIGANVVNVMVTSGRVKWISWIYFPMTWWQPD